MFLIEGAVRRGYYPMRQPVSALARGPRGWIQRVNFFITGALSLLYAFGLYTYGDSFWIPLLVAAFGVGLIGAGVFVTDITGLPGEAPKAGQRPREGVLHDLFSLPVFAGLFVACILYSFHFYRAGELWWSLYSGVSGAVLFIFFILAGIGFSGDSKIGPVGGLMQRISIIAGLTWLSLVAAHILQII